MELPPSTHPAGSEVSVRAFDFFLLRQREMTNAPRSPRRIPPMRATAIPALAAVVNPVSPFDCVDCVGCVGLIDCVGCVDCVDCVGCVPLLPSSDKLPKPSYIVLLSGTVILQTHYRFPRDDSHFSTHMKASMFKSAPNGLLIVIWCSLDSSSPVREYAINWALSGLLPTLRLLVSV